MYLVITYLVIAVTLTGVSSRSYYHSPVDLNNDFYTEMRNLLKEQLDNRGGSQISHPQEVRNWPREPLNLGQVSGVAVDGENRPVIFHRGTHVWDQSSFNLSNHYQLFPSGAIDENTLLTLDPRTGSVLSGRGKGIFHMPHGLFIDHEGNYWTTDVALHQVFKFPPGSETPSLILGIRGEPGEDEKHFCKPTDVAVATNGVFFVADGYCNSRIMHYTPTGTLITKIGDKGVFNIPHSLALFEGADILCVADRENERVACFNAGLVDPAKVGLPAGEISLQRLGRIYAIAPHDDHLFGVNGPSFQMQNIQGFTIDANKGTIIDTWGPQQRFETPHDITVTLDGTTIYVVEIGPNRVWKFLLETEDVHLLK